MGVSRTGDLVCAGSNSNGQCSFDAAAQDTGAVSAEWDRSHFTDFDYAENASYEAYGSAVLSLSSDAVYVTVTTFDSDSSRGLYQLPCESERFVRLEIWYYVYSSGYGESIYYS